MASRRLRARPREKMFGLGRPRALDRNAKARIMHLARGLSRRTDKGKAYGQITAKALAVLEALLWGFHNAKSGLCFPSYEKIAEAAGCARSTVAEAIKALEDAGILSWVNRLKHVAEASRNLFGHRIRKTRVFAPAMAMCSLTRNHLRRRNPSPILLSPIFRLEPRFKSLYSLSRPQPRAFSTPITPLKVP